MTDLGTSTADVLNSQRILIQRLNADRDRFLQALQQVSTMYCDTRSRNNDGNWCPDEYDDQDNWCWKCVALKALRTDYRWPGNPV